MKHLAIGWACNLNEIFLRFPYEKCKNIMKNFKTFNERRKLIKQVFRESVHLILIDIIDNNTIFTLPKLKSYSGEIRMSPTSGEEFIEARKNGKFSKIDFLESLFTGYSLNLYIKGKRDNFLHAHCYDIHVGSYYKNKIIENTNNGMRYG